MLDFLVMDMLVITFEEYIEDSAKIARRRKNGSFRWTIPKGCEYAQEVKTAARLGR